MENHSRSISVSQHQRNFQVLQQLRTTTESLDSRIKTTLSSLAELRSELIKSTPLSLPSGQKAVRPVDANELLNFAQRIARSAPTSTQSGAQSQPELPVESVETQIKRESPAPPLPSGMDDTSVPGASGAGQPPPGTDQTTRTGRGKAIDALRPDYKQWLEQGSSQSIDVPWADQGMAMKSALNSLDKASPETDT